MRVVTHDRDGVEGLPMATAGVPPKSWLGTDSCGGPLVLLCVPVGMTNSERKIFILDNDRCWIH